MIIQITRPEVEAVISRRLWSEDAEDIIRHARKTFPPTQRAPEALLAKGIAELFASPHPEKWVSQRNEVGQFAGLMLTPHFIHTAQ
jgi:hypothetical protein